MSRSSNSPRYFAPATIAPRSSATSRLPRSDSGTSPATMRCARPSTTAVLPTPGSPISTGLFLVRRRQHLHDAADLGVAADHRVELARRGPAAVRSTPYFVQRVVGALGVGAGDPGAAADAGQRGQQRLPGGAAFARTPATCPSGPPGRRAALARPMSRCSVETYSSPSSRRDLAGRGERLVGVPAEAGRAHRRAAGAGQRGEAALGGRPSGRDVGADGAEQRRRDAVRLLEQRGEQVRGLHLRVAVGGRPPDGGGHRLLAAGGELEIHESSVLRGSVHRCNTPRVESVPLNLRLRGRERARARPRRR